MDLKEIKLILDQPAALLYKNPQWFREAIIWSVKEIESLEKRLNQVNAPGVCKCERVL